MAIAVRICFMFISFRCQQLLVTAGNNTYVIARGHNMGDLVPSLM